MSRRLMALSWLSVLVMAGLLGHLTAQKLHAIPLYGYCPTTTNTPCPSCPTDDLGNPGCHITSGSYYTCVYDNNFPKCGHTYSYTCKGLLNAMLDCSGMDTINLCLTTEYSCN